MEDITDQICSMQDKLVTPSEGMFPAVDIVKVIQKQDIVAYFAVVEVSSYELKGTKLIVSVQACVEWYKQIIATNGEEV